MLTLMLNWFNSNRSDLKYPSNAYFDAIAIPVLLFVQLIFAQFAYLTVLRICANKMSLVAAYTLPILVHLKFYNFIFTSR